MHRRELLVGAGVAFTHGCLHNGSTDGRDESGEDEETQMSLRSPAFDDGGEIPSSYTCDGANGSPALRVNGVPEEADTLALIVDDPDAEEVAGKVWVHWLLWNVPADTEEIPRAVSQGGEVDELDRGIQGTNDNDEVGYSGPCPPEDDDSHTYRFTLYAVKGELELGAGATRDQLEEALDGRTVAQARLEGEYER